MITPDKVEVHSGYVPEVVEFVKTVCDYMSGRQDEGLANVLYFVDEIPEDLYVDLPAGQPQTSGSEFVHSPKHQWWYFPEMNRDEILVLHTERQ